MSSSKRQQRETESAFPVSLSGDLLRNCGTVSHVGCSRGLSRDAERALHVSAVVQSSARRVLGVLGVGGSHLRDYINIEPVRRTPEANTKYY